MDDIRNSVAKNITKLRQLNGMTQVELAAKLNYSDKTISKWERAESSPDITVLVEMADIFNVSVDYLVRGDVGTQKKESNLKESKYNRRAIAYISECAAWVAAIFAFIITSLITGEITFQWLYFVYVLPIALIIKLVFNSIWFNPRHNYSIISALIWSILTAVYVAFKCFDIDVSLIFILGAAAQVVVIMWSFISKPKKKEN